MAAANLNHHNANSSRLTVVSYNLHGFNQGITGIVELIRLSSPDVFLVQKHWLTPDNLSKLDMNNDDYFGSSAMGCCYSRSLVR